MDIDLTTIKHVHFIGIGGIGISAIARMMIHEGKTVSGQDVNESEITHELIKAGATITIGQSLEAIPHDADLIVYTIAIENYDPELFEKLKSQSITIRSYPQMLHIVTEGKYTIAISGTHGKTTTTAMISGVLCDAQLDPTVVVGSLLNPPGASSETSRSNFIAGKSKYFVVEACEYRRSFLNINPNILVITNIDEDHLDYYKDIEDIKSAFRELAMKVPADGFVVCDPNGPIIKEVVAGIAATVVDYSSAIDLNLPLKVPGVYNKHNAGAATSVATVLGVELPQIHSSLLEFKGTWRRFEFKGKLANGAMIYDDYAHHPAEIKATLQGFRELYSKENGWKITVVFQPHLFSRTKALLNEFSTSFADADRVLILPIYPAREVDDGTISAHILSEKIQGVESHAFESFENAEDYLQKTTFGSKEIVVTMGAGEAFKVGEVLLA